MNSVPFQSMRRKKVGSEAILIYNAILISQQLHTLGSLPMIIPCSLISNTFQRKGLYTVVEKYWHPYLINTIEMRSFWTEIKYIKSVARVLDRNCANKGDLDLSKEVLRVSVGQRAADLKAVKVGGQKKFCWSARFEPSSPAMGQSAEFFLTFIFDSL